MVDSFLLQIKSVYMNQCKANLETFNGVIIDGIIDLG